MVVALNEMGTVFFVPVRLVLIEISLRSRIAIEHGNSGGPVLEFLVANRVDPFAIWLGTRVVDGPRAAFHSDGRRSAGPTCLLFTAHPTRLRKRARNETNESKPVTK